MKFVDMEDDDMEIDINKILAKVSRVSIEFQTSATQKPLNWILYRGCFEQIDPYAEMLWKSTKNISEGWALVKNTLLKLKWNGFQMNREVDHKTSKKQNKFIESEIKNRLRKYN